MVRMRAVIRFRTHAGGIDRAGDSIFLECGKACSRLVALPVRGGEGARKKYDWSTPALGVETLHA